MTLLYVTSDRVGQADHGGGQVTYHESEALRTLGPLEVWDHDRLVVYGIEKNSDPWGWDETASHEYRDNYVNPPKLAHFYAGTFSKTVAGLKKSGAKVTYTAAAHSIEVSKREHEKLGIPYNYPHLTDKDLWVRYLGGYLAADCVICPSSLSASCMAEYGCKRVEVIPHGVNLPQEDPKPHPKVFTVGYLGAVGPDKGLVYLLQAWKKLNYKDAVLQIAGRDVQHPWVQNLCRTQGGGKIWLRGWVENPADFYNSVSLYVQPSASEGFGCEVLEAMSYNRPVLCSSGAGACGLVPKYWVFPACDSDSLAKYIDWARRIIEKKEDILHVPNFREIAENHTWDKIKERYVKLWKTILGE